MTDSFDELSRTLARPDRRGLFKMAAAAIGGAVALTVLKPFRAVAAPSCPGVTCGSSCCQPGVVCLDASNGICGCLAGRKKCGQTCCSGTCSDAATSCCCAAGQTPCGTTCCAGGTACIDRASGKCGCPSGTTSCGNAANRTCCPSGQSCANASSCPPPPAPLGCSCRTYADPCSTNGQCCSGVCSSFKGDRCGCNVDADCPSSSPICGTNGVCHS